MAPFETILLERGAGIARMTLHRPDVRNAFDGRMIHELRAAFASLKEDAAVRAVVLTGEGSAFCAGADLRWMGRVREDSFKENREETLELARLMRAIYELPKPVVARVNGAAIGGGAGLVAACDIAVASEQAVFSLSEVKFGLVPACIAPYVLKRIGERFAREYFLTGERLTAQKALACGLVNRVVAPQDLDAAVQAYLDAFSAAGPGALAVCKRMVHEVADLDLEKAGPATAEMVARLRASEEGREGMSAFLEGRQPRWAPAREQKG